uniref:Uncharacterized protein n=1 Tax=Anguilla anguilla TaxID=7936 RepID=A0A0E9TXU2_ANGAN
MNVLGLDWIILSTNICVCVCVCVCLLSYLSSSQVKNSKKSIP